MVPHVEEFTGKYQHDLGDMATGGIYTEVPGTSHATGDQTEEAKKAHQLVQQDAEKYREVADELGSVCDEIRKPQQLKHVRHGGLFFEMHEKE